MRELNAVTQRKTCEALSNLKGINNTIASDELISSRSIDLTINAEDILHAIFSGNNKNITFAADTDSTCLPLWQETLLCQLALAIHLCV